MYSVSLWTKVGVEQEFVKKKKKKPGEWVAAAGEVLFFVFSKNEKIQAQIVYAFR